jgi:hypothetical protein
MWSSPANSLPDEGPRRDGPCRTRTASAMSSRTSVAGAVGAGWRCRPRVHHPGKPGSCTSGHAADLRRPGRSGRAPRLVHEGVEGRLPRRAARRARIPVTDPPRRRTSVVPRRQRSEGVRCPLRSAAVSGQPRTAGHGTERLVGLGQLAHVDAGREREGSCVPGDDRAFLDGAALPTQRTPIKPFLAPPERTAGMKDTESSSTSTDEITFYVDAPEPESVSSGCGRVSPQSERRSSHGGRSRGSSKHAPTCCRCVT